MGDMGAKTQGPGASPCSRKPNSNVWVLRARSKWNVRVHRPHHQDLEEEITRRPVFPPIFYFRLSVIPIQVPSLSERREDIPPLVQHFVSQFSRDNNRRLARFSPGALEVLASARWRGNIRELKNVVERILIMTDRDVIEADDVRQVVRTESRPAGAAGAQGLAAAQASGPKPATLREFKEASERAFLVEKLREFGWNISKTADVIDTPRSNLYKKLEQYNIKQELDG